MSRSDEQHPTENPTECALTKDEIKARLAEVRAKADRIYDEIEEHEEAVIDLRSELSEIEDEEGRMERELLSLTDAALAAVSSPADALALLAEDDDVWLAMLPAGGAVGCSHGLLCVIGLDVAERPGGFLSLDGVRVGAGKLLDARQERSATTTRERLAYACEAMSEDDPRHSHAVTFGIARYDASIVRRWAGSLRGELRVDEIHADTGCALRISSSDAVAVVMERHASHGERVAPVEHEVRHG